MVRCGCNAASATTCDAIVLCVAANLGAGLRYDTVSGLLSVRLSGDAGNAASFGSDNGLFVPGEGASPDPASGRKSVPGLPVRTFGATQGGGGGMVPFGSPESIEYGVANRMDIIVFHTFALADEVALNRWGNPPDGALSDRTDNPSAIESRHVSSVQLPSLLVDAGTRVSPTGRDSGAPASLLTPDGGWFGFYGREFSPLTLSQALHLLAARSVAYLAVFGGFNQITDLIPRNVNAAISAVIQTGAQDWTIIGVSPYVDDGSGNIIVSPDIGTWVGDITGAGITASVDLFEDQPAGFAMTPAAVIATGAEWVRFRVTEAEGGTSLARVQEFVDAGLQVIVQTDSRQWTTQRVYTMGVRAVLADSPVYARGGRGEAGDLAYRKTVVIPGLITRTQMEGALTRRTNNGISVADVGWARQSDVGRNFSAQFGWEGGIGAHLHSQLLGELSPYEVTADYRLRIRSRVDPTQATVPAGLLPKLGVFFNAPTDRDITYFGATGPPWVNGYSASIRIGSQNQGQITLGKFNNGVFTVLAQDSSFPSVSYGNWINFAIRTTPTAITLTVAHTTGTGATLVVNDTDHRGPYAYYLWEDAYIPPAENSGFAHGYSAYAEFASTFPMYEDLT